MSRVDSRVGELGGKGFIWVKKYVTKNIRIKVLQGMLRLTDLVPSKKKGLQIYFNKITLSSHLQSSK